MMKKLINLFKKLLGYKEVCPKCKSNPCKCEPEIPAEHIRVVECTPVEEVAYKCEFPVTDTEAASDAELSKTKKVSDVSINKEEVKVTTPKKKRAPRKKKVESEKK